MNGKQHRSLSRYRWSVFSRVLAATLGGYVVAWLFVAALALVLHGMLGVRRVDAVVGASMSGLVVFIAMVIAAFHLRSAVRAWALAVVCAVPLGIVVWVLPV